jgi:hypothetical protein
MSAWSNIEISRHDSEINEIDKLEKTLGKVSENIQNIRELITRFEVCHFKYQQHFKHIKDSIRNLKPNVKPIQIGANHFSKGKDALNNDKTGRSKLGQQYVCSLMKWLGDYSPSNSNYFNNELNQQITTWLGNKNPNKERLVRLLIARLIWDWKAYEEHQQGGEYKELEMQACRMDICHYAFPKHLDLLLQGIGIMESIDNFEGCGSYNTDITAYVEKQFSILCDYLKSNTNRKNLEKNEKIKLWLIACFAKTLKELVGLKKSLPQLISLR